MKKLFLLVISLAFCFVGCTDIEKYRSPGGLSYQDITKQYSYITKEDFIKNSREHNKIVNLFNKEKSDPSAKYEILMFATFSDDVDSSSFEKEMKAQSYTCDEIEYMQWAISIVSKTDPTTVDHLTLKIRNIARKHKAYSFELVGIQ